VELAVHTLTGQLMLSTSFDFGRKVMVGHLLHQNPSAKGEEGVDMDVDGADGIIAGVFSHQLPLVEVLKHPKLRAMDRFARTIVNAVFDLKRFAITDEIRAIAAIKLKTKFKLAEVATEELDMEKAAASVDGKSNQVFLRLNHQSSKWLEVSVSPNAQKVSAAVLMPKCGTNTRVPLEPVLTILGGESSTRLEGDGKPMQAMHKKKKRKRRDTASDDIDALPVMSVEEHPSLAEYLETVAEAALAWQNPT